MDQEEFHERAARLQEVGKIIEKLPVEIRSEAFRSLRDYISPAMADSRHEASSTEQGTEEGDSVDFFSKFNHEKPSDSVRLIAAHLFQEYGSAPFTTEELKTMATNVGITIPDRVDMTLTQAAENGRSLFTRVGRGKFKPTVHGEAYLKTTYGVRKGTKIRAGDKR